MSTQVDLIIKNGLVVTGQRVVDADIAITDGVIKEISRGISSKPGVRTVDATGKYVLPGIIDVHVHFHVEPPYVDDLQAASRTAAFGGVTTILPFLFVKKGDGLITALQRATDDGQKNSFLDFGFHPCMFDTRNQLVEIPEAAKLGVTSFKMLMTYSKLGYMASDDVLLAAMELIAENKGLAMVHAENGVAIDYLQDKFIAQGDVRPEHYASTQPVVLEAEAINRVIALASIPVCPLYIPHISTGAVLWPILRARDEGQTVYAETCPQYLLLTNRELTRRGALAKIGPPLREDEDRESLWQAVADGVIDVIASDHVPKNKEGAKDIFDAPYGAPGAETLLTMMYDEGINKGKITICRLVELLCENPAKIFGLYPQKGTLQVGSDADVVVFDPQVLHTISHETLHTNTAYTLYEGRECLGAPVLSLQRGKVVLENGELKASPGQGHFLFRGDSAS